MIEASLYMYSATLYPQTTDNFSDITMRVHLIETAAASIEFAACIGWFLVWYATYDRNIVGRGWTLDDPDLWANALLMIPSVIYLVYNAQILHDPSSYGSNTLYELGDLLYAIGSLFYLFASLRDDGWFFFMPTAGKLPGRWGETRSILVAPSDEDDEWAEKMAKRSTLQYILQDWIGCGKPNCLGAKKICNHCCRWW